jgi:Flp pilus assembly protein TadD
MRLAPFFMLALMLAASGCALSPFESGHPESKPGGSHPGGPAPGSGPVITSVPEVGAAPAPGPESGAIAQPAPLPRERPKVTPATLGPASRSLVTQAQTQRKKGDLPGATVSLERALRIEPNNPLLWIEMGRLRMDQQNYPQAESMGRKALSMSVGDPHTQSSAWLLISDSLKARGRNPQAQDALAKSKELSGL